MKNKDAINLLNSNHRRDFYCPECQIDDECKTSCEYGQALDLAIKALEIVESIKSFIRKHNALDSLELMCIKDIINGENEE